MIALDDVSRPRGRHDLIAYRATRKPKLPAAMKSKAAAELPVAAAIFRI
jgi:hypothetical protein